MDKLTLYAKVVWAAVCSGSTRSFYDRISDIYDHVFTDHITHANNIADLLSIFRPLAGKGLALDLGCGTGLVSKGLIERGFHVIGLDMSFRSLKVLQRNQQRVIMMQGNMEHLPFKNDSVDAISCLGVWRHLKNPEIVVAEVSRVLGKTGAFALGYFPPKLGGLFYVNNTSSLGRLLALMYSHFVRLMGYNDQVRRCFEENTLQLLYNRFENVHKVQSGEHSYLIVASGRKSLSRNFIGVQ